MFPPVVTEKADRLATRRSHTIVLFGGGSERTLSPMGYYLALCRVRAAAGSGSTNSVPALARLLLVSLTLVVASAIRPIPYQSTAVWRDAPIRQ